MIAVWRNGFSGEKPNLNKKIAQLTHSELDIKHKKSLKKNLFFEQFELNIAVRHISSVKPSSQNVKLI